MEEGEEGMEGREGEEGDRRDGEERTRNKETILKQLPTSHSCSMSTYWETKMTKSALSSRKNSGIPANFMGGCGGRFSKLSLQKKTP